MVRQMDDLLRSYEFDNYYEFPQDLIHQIIEYLLLEFIALDRSIVTLRTYNNLVTRVTKAKQRFHDGIYSLAFVPIHFDEHRPSQFNFKIVHQELNVIMGCMIVYNIPSNYTSMIHKLLQKHNNHSFQSNYIGSGTNGYSYDSSGLLLHNNAIYGMNTELETGT
eukprot:280919_1